MAPVNKELDRLAENGTLEEVRNWYFSCPTEQRLADAYAIASNTAFWVVDDIYDFDEGSEGYINAYNTADSWFALTNELQDIIISLLREDGKTIPECGIIKVLCPFMFQYGYYDNAGWWEPISDI